MELIKATIARRTAYASVGYLEHQFDAFDTKHRQFGARVILTVSTFEDQETELWNYPNNLRHANENRRPAGTYFGFRPHALRAGKLYGASHGEQLFADENERNAAVSRYFAEAEKRALKNKARAS
jgi:hypothetical protein